MLWECLLNDKVVDDARIALLVPVGGPGHPLAGVIPHVRY